MTVLLKLWLFLNGKKTAIAFVLKGVADIATVLNQPEIAQVVDIVGNTLGAIGLGHKGVKIKSTK